MKIEPEMLKGEEKEEKTQEELAREVIEQTMIHQEFGEEVDWNTYVAGVSRELEVQTGDLADFILDELGKIQEKSLKITDSLFVKRMQKLFDINDMLMNGMKKDIQGTNAAEIAMDDGEKVRFFRQEYVDDKGRDRYIYNARPQKAMNQMVNDIMGGRIPQMHGQMPQMSQTPQMPEEQPPPIQPAPPGMETA